MAFSKSKFLAFIAACALLTPLSALAALPSLAEATAKLTKIDGYVPLYWDSEHGKLLLEISRWNREFLYMASLPAGLGSNDIGLDRGLLSDPQVVEWQRIGPRVLLVQKNYGFRASSQNPLEQRAVRDSFATSVLWGFDITATTADSALVDATDFFLRDAAGVVRAIQSAKQGSFRLDPKRSAFYLDRTKAFPKNSEVEVTLTFAGDDPGRYIQQVTPSPQSITLREHHSLIELPDDGFRPRAFDPRSGFIEMRYRDYSAPLGEDIDRRFIVRHRLTHGGRPIVYYVDGGAPDDVRSALMEGGSWWAQAFEAAGFPDAFQVKVLPADADPMDIRYNVVQWVHRYTRGWSYGNAISDPRTGEILKGQVTLGSLRYRQDYLIFSSLLSPFSQPMEALSQVKEAVYARLRQLAAHEIGHTLGLAHNYIASTHGNASVMDYPHPMVALRPDGSLDLSHAYAAGIGEWDKVAIRYGYSEVPSGTDEKTALSQILLDAAQQGNIFISDADSRPLGSVHPKAHLWDNGPNALDELERLLKVRSTALAHFGENTIPVGEPWSRLDETLVPLYFLHRYQTEAAAKLLGGLDYTYALRGDGQLVAAIVSPESQRRALKLLLETASPVTLTLPERILRLIPPHPPAYERTRESMPSETGLTFDPLASAEAAAGLTGSLLFHPERAARLLEYHARNAANPGLEEVFQQVALTQWFAAAPAGLAGEVKHSVDIVWFEQALALAQSPRTSPAVRAAVPTLLRAMKPRLPAYLSRLLDEYQRDPNAFKIPTEAEAPPGQPIGEDLFDGL